MVPPPPEDLCFLGTVQSNRNGAESELMPVQREGRQTTALITGDERSVSFLEEKQAQDLFLKK